MDSGRAGLSWQKKLGQHAANAATAVDLNSSDVEGYEIAVAAKRFELLVAECRKGLPGQCDDAFFTGSQLDQISAK
jgi:hypothetical protein